MISDKKTLTKLLSLTAAVLMTFTACGSEDSSSKKSKKTDSSAESSSAEVSVTDSSAPEDNSAAAPALTPEEMALKDYAEVVKQEETACGRLFFPNENMLTAFGVKYISLTDLDGDGTEELILISSDYSGGTEPRVKIFTHTDDKAVEVFSGETFSDNVDIIPLDIWQGEDDGKIYYQSGCAMIGDWKMVSVKDGAALEYTYTDKDYYNYRNSDHPEGIMTIAGKTYKRISTQPLYDCMPPKESDLKIMTEQVDKCRQKLGLGTLAEAEASLSEEERFAEAVVNDEYLWLGMYDKMPNGTNDKPECWFQDVDFDGEPEFIIGGFNMQTQGGIGYSIYKMKGGRLVKQVDSFYKDRRDEYDTKRIPSAAACLLDTQKTGGHGFEAIGGEVLKNDKGGYILVLPAIYSYIADGYLLTSYTLEDDATVLANVGGFSYETKDMQSYGFGKDFNISKEQLRNEMQNFFGSLKHCDITTGVIPCTQAAKNITEANKGDYICGCYNNLTRQERIEALVKSYNAYSLTDTALPSKIYEIFKTDLKQITGS